MYCLGLGQHNIEFENSHVKLFYYNLGEPIEVDCELKKYEELQL